MSMATELAADLQGIEAVETAARPSRVSLRRVWAGLWPKLAAVFLILAVWQVVVWSGWKPDYVLPGPLQVFQRLAGDLSHPDFYVGVAITLRRALMGYAIAVALGGVMGILVARVTFLRKAIGSAILGLQSMPSIAWFPLAIKGRALPLIIIYVLPDVGSFCCGCFSSFFIERGWPINCARKTMLF